MEGLSIGSVLTGTTPEGASSRSLNRDVSVAGAEELAGLVLTADGDIFL